MTNKQILILSGTKSSYRLKLRDSGKPQQSTTTAKYDMNDCLLESENFQITKSDNNKYLLLPVKKQDIEKFVLKECGKDIDSYTQKPSFTHTHTSHFLLFFEIKFAKKTQNLCHQIQDNVPFVSINTWFHVGMATLLFLVPFFYLLIVGQSKTKALNNYHQPCVNYLSWFKQTLVGSFRSILCDAKVTKVFRNLLLTSNLVLMQKIYILLLHFVWMPINYLLIFDWLSINPNNCCALWKKTLFAFF